MNQGIEEIGNSNNRLESSNRLGLLKYVSKVLGTILIVVGIGLFLYLEKGLTTYFYIFAGLAIIGPVVRALFVQAEVFNIALSNERKKPYPFVRNALIFLWTSTLCFITAVCCYMSSISAGILATKVHTNVVRSELTAIFTRAEILAPYFDYLLVGAVVSTSGAIILHQWLNLFMREHKMGTGEELKQLWIEIRHVLSRFREMIRGRFRK